MIQIKIKKPTVKIQLETRNFLISFIIVALITYTLTYAEIWQLIIIPGIIGGFFNKSMRRGIYSGALGVSVVWIIYLIYLIAAKNFFISLDHFAGLIFGDIGYGSVILILIILFGVLFGALGGGIGSGIMILLLPFLKEQKSETIESKGKLKQSNS